MQRASAESPATPGFAVAGRRRTAASAPAGPIVDVDPTLITDAALALLVLHPSVDADQTALPGREWRALSIARTGVEREVVGTARLEFLVDVVADDGEALRLETVLPVAAGRSAPPTAVEALRREVEAALAEGHVELAALTLDRARAMKLPPSLRAEALELAARIQDAQQAGDAAHRVGRALRLLEEGPLEDGLEMYIGRNTDTRRSITSLTHMQ